MDLAIAQTIIKSSNQGGILTYQNEKNSPNKKKSVIFNTNTNHEHDDVPDDEIDDTKKQYKINSLVKLANSKLNFYVNNENIKKPNQVVIEVYLIFLRVGEIDNVKERFQADAYFEACWEDSSVDPNAPFDPRQHWEPELFIENAVGNLKQEIKYRVEKRGNRTMIFETRTVKGIFWERLELWDFPLDIQSLSISITTSRDKNEIKFVESKETESTINTKDFQQQQEWNLYSHIEISQKSVYDVWKDHNRPCITISSTISRRPGYFIYNAYMLIFLISALGFVPFSFSYRHPHFRIQINCLLILSSVNFRWIVTQKLPTVSYLTVLDKYAIGALVFLVSLCVWHAMIGSSFASPEKCEICKEIDKFALISIGLLYFLFHFIYIIYFLFKYSRYSKVGLTDPQPVQTPQININSDAYFFEREKKIIESLAINPFFDVQQTIRSSNNNRHEDMSNHSTNLKMNSSSNEYLKSRSVPDMHLSKKMANLKSQNLKQS